MYKEGQTATNPQTGQKVVYKNGSWVSAQGSPQRGDTPMQGGQWPSGATRLPNGDMVMHGPRGGLIKLGGEMPSLTEAEGRNVGFAGRQLQAENAYQSAIQSGYNPTSFRNNTANFIEGVPDGGLLNPLSMAIRDKPSQIGHEAEKTFGLASIRKDSGASYKDSELRDIINDNFPHFGADSAQAVAQKQAVRQAYYDGSRMGSGYGQKTLPAQLTAPRSKPQISRPQTITQNPNIYPPLMLKALQGRKWDGNQPAGSQSNPHLVTNQAKFNAIPHGSWFIDEDGVLDTKK